MTKMLASVGFLMVSAVAYAAPKATDVLFIGKFGAKGVSQDDAGMIESAACTAASGDGRFVVRCQDASGKIAELRQMQAELGFAEGEKFKDDCGKAGCIDALSKTSDAKWILSGTLAKVAEKQYLLTVLVVDPASSAQLNRVEEKIAGGLDAVVDRVPGVVRKALTPQQAQKPAAAAPAPAPAKK